VRPISWFHVTAIHKSLRSEFAKTAVTPVPDRGWALRLFALTRPRGNPLSPPKACTFPDSYGCLLPPALGVYRAGCVIGALDQDSSMRLGVAHLVRPPAACTNPWLRPVSGPRLLCSAR